MIDRYIARIDYMAWCGLLFMGIETEFHIFEPLVKGHLEKIDDALIKSASIIVSFTIGFLVNKHFDAKKLRRDKFAEFTKTQTNLIKYFEAFWQLRDELSRKYAHLDPQYQIPYKEYKMNTLGSETPAQFGFGNIVLHSLMSLSRYYLRHSMPGNQGKVLSTIGLEEIEYILSDLSAFFARRKYYQYILEDLKLNPTMEIEDVVVTDRPEILSARASTIAAKDGKDDFEMLGFWINKIDEALALTQNLIELTPFLHDYENRTEKSILSCLLNVSVYGILFPLILIAFEWAYNWHAYLSLMCLSLFIWNFIKALNILKKEIRETSIGI